MKKRTYFIMIFLLILFNYAYIVTSETGENNYGGLSEIIQLSDELLHFSQEKDSVARENILQALKEKLSIMSYSDKNLNNHDLQLLLSLINHFDKASRDEQFLNDEIYNEALKVRLLVDVLASQERPLWKNMKARIFNSLNFLNDNELSELELNNQINSFLQVYEIVYPSFVVSLTNESLINLTNQVNYIDSHRQQLFLNKTISSEVANLEIIFKAIFNEVEEDEADPSLWWVILTTGGIIFITLSYVAWRKYDGQKKKQQDRPYH